MSSAPEPQRCAWLNLRNKEYVDYHDKEWGRRVPDSRLYELLMLECFQAGLSWECVLRKRTRFREVFAGWEARTVARFDSGKIDALMRDAGIIRHRAKIEAAVVNARAFLALSEEYGSFTRFIESVIGDETVTECRSIPSPAAEELSRRLRKHGMKFTGPSTVYAFLQAAGFINAHEPGCFLHPDAGKKG